MAFSFENLHVYQRAVDFADKVCSSTEQFARGYGFLVEDNVSEGPTAHPLPHSSLGMVVPLGNLINARHHLTNDIDGPLNRPEFGRCPGLPS